MLFLLALVADRMQLEFSTASSMIFQSDSLVLKLAEMVSKPADMHQVFPVVLWAYCMVLAHMFYKMTMVKLSNRIQFQLAWIIQVSDQNTHT